VEIVISDTKVRDLCCSRRNLVRQFGEALAKRICCRLSMLEAAPTLAHMPTSPPIGLAAVDRKGSFSVVLDAAHRLHFRASGFKAEWADELHRVIEIDIIGPAPVQATRGTRK
jgi:hypothetical protein